MQEARKDKTPLHIILSFVSITVGIAIIILSVLQLFNVWSNAVYVYIPLMGINLLLQAYAQWVPNRKVAIFSLCAAVIVFICAALVYIIK